MDTLLINEHAGGIVVLTFNRPQAHHALTLAMMQAFADAVAGLHALPQLRAVILTGAGDSAFCSGGDLLELSGYPTEADALAFITVMGDALHRLEALSVPVIAAINGYALGGGSEIALACDFRIASENARMGFVQIRNAVIPGWGGGQRLLRLVGYSQALDLLLSARTLTATDAHALGLVNRVVEAGQALPGALAWAEEIAALPVDVVRSMKALLHAGLTLPYAAALDAERALFPPLWAAEPHLNAVAEFLKRRK